MTFNPLENLVEVVDSFSLESALKFDFYNPVTTGHTKHYEFHGLGKTSKQRLFLAANRIGKTRSASLEVCMHLTGYYPSWWNGYVYDHPIEAWVCGVTSKEVYEVLERRYFEGIDEESWIHPSLIAERNKINHSYRIRHKTGGCSSLRFKTYEQGREAFQAASLHVLHVDEEPPFDIYTEGLMRTMATSDSHHGMVIASMTPLKGQTQLIQYFTQTKDIEKDTIKLLSPAEVHQSRVYIMAGWENAPHLPPEEQANMIAACPPHEIEARTKGIPSLGSGMVYPVPESLVRYHPFEIPDHWPCVFGLDFGWKDPTAALFAAVDRDNDIVYLYGEYAATQMTPQHHSYELIKQGANWMAGVYDPSGKISSQKDGSKLVEIYRECGLRNLTPADNSREAGVQKVLQRMQNGKLKIVSTLTKTWNELRMYARNKDGLLQDGNDHLMDCMRYIISSGLPLARVKNYQQRMYPHQQSPYGSTGGGWMRV